MKVEVKEAQSNEVLQQGDYVTNLTEEQFDELVNISDSHITWDANKQKSNKFYISKSVVYEEQTLLHSDLSMLIIELPFEEFKQRAINTFKG